MIGLYLVSECEAVPGGYLFTVAGQDGFLFQLAAGFAYLPDGPPAEVDWFDGPEFESLGGGWYRFTSSW